MNLRELLLEKIERTGKGDTAVIGWGRGMGHKGHMMLASSVITHAKELGGDPYFVVSRTFGPDDPLKPEEKLAIYKKVFPEQGHIFQTASDELPDLTRVLTNLNQQGYRNAVVVVGADQVKAFQYLNNYNGKPNKAGDIPFQFDDLQVISRQMTNDPSREEEGPRATPMRQVLLDPTKSDEEQFAVWRDAMSDNIPDEEVRDLMMKAKERMISMKPEPKKAPAKKKAAEPAVAEGSLEEYGDTPKGQKMLAKVQSRAAKRIMKNWDNPNRDFELAKKNRDNAERAYARIVGKKDYSKGVEEGMFGLSTKEKAAIMNVTAKISDIPGNWDHERQTYTERGLEDLKSVMKNEKYLKYALSLTSKDYDADLGEGKKFGMFGPDIGDRVTHKFTGATGVIKRVITHGDDTHVQYRAEYDTPLVKKGEMVTVPVKQIKPAKEKTEGLKPGWMLKKDPELAKKVKQNTDLAKKRQQSYGDPSKGISKNEDRDVISNMAKRLTDPKDGATAKLRAAGDKRREQQMKSRDIAKRDNVKKNSWGDYEVDESMITRHFKGIMKRP